MRRPRRPNVTGLVAIAVVVLAVVILLRAIGDLLDFGNPFGTETVDRSAPAVLRSIQDLREYRAAIGHFEVIVDVEEDVRFVPQAIKGERVLFVAVGSVDALVDFTALTGEGVEVSDDRTSATITLPPAQLGEARVDPEESYVYHRDRGIVDRVASLFEESPTGERQLYILAEQKLISAAQSGSGLLRRAEENTRSTLEAMLHALGFQRVRVEFADDPR